MNPSVAGALTGRRVQGDERRPGVSAGGAGPDGVIPRSKIRALRTEIVDIDAPGKAVIAIWIENVDDEPAVGARDVADIPEVHTDGQAGVITAELEQAHLKAAA